MEVSPGKQMKKIVRPDTRLPFWEALASCSKGMGECKDNILWPTFPESISVASRHVPNLKPAAKVKAPRLENRSLL